MTRQYSLAPGFQPADAPEGFVYREEAVSPSEERHLVDRLAALPLRPFEFHGHLGARRVISFGWRYAFDRHSLIRCTPLPGFLLELRRRAAAVSGLAPESLEQALVTEYPPGAGIGWHRDKPAFGDVVAFSLLASCRLRFRHQGQSGFQRKTCTVEPRSVYLLRGPSRSQWEHSIPAVDQLRYSVTYRNLSSCAADAVDMLRSHERDSNK